MPTISQRLSQFGSFDLRHPGVEDSTCPPPPQPSITANSTQQGVVTVQWTAPSTNSLEIFRSPGNIVYQSNPEIGTSPSSGTFIDQSLDPNVYYTYVARSSNTCGESWSSAITIKPICTLPQPVSLTLSMGVSSVTLAFDIQANTNSYVLNRSDGTKVNISIPYGVSNFTYVDSDIEADKNYAYSIESINECGSVFSNSVVGMVDCQLPPKTILDLTSDYSDITVTWTEVVNVTKYRLYRWKESDPKLLLSEFLSGDNTYSYKDQGLTSETSYYYQLELINECGSIFSDAFNITISCSDIEKPELSITKEDGSVLIEWTAVDVATEYQVWRDNEDELISITAGDLRYVVDPEAAKIKYNYTDSNIVPGQTYSYRILAKTDCKSVSSNAQSVKADCENPGQPQNFKAVSAVQKVVLLWSPVENAAGYKVFRDDESRPIAITPSCKFIDTAVEPGNTYSYQVLAYNDCGEGELTSKKTVAVKCVCMNTPANLKLTKLETTLRLTWDVEVAAETYEVFKNGQSYSEVKEPEFTDLYTEGSGAVFYQVRAKNVCETTKLSTMVESGLECDELTGEFDLRIVGKTDTTATYVWDEITNAVKYIIVKYNSTTGETSQIDVKELMQTNIYVDYMLQENSNYKVTIFAENACGDRIQSKVVPLSTSCNIPQYPVGFNRVSLTSAAVKFSWAPAERADEYVVYRNGYKYDEVAKTVFVDSDIIPANKYYYSIASKNSCGETARTTPVEIYVPCVPVTKTEISTATVARTGVTVEWAEVEGSKEYWVYRDGKRVAKTEINQFYDQNILPSTQYIYKVATTNECDDYFLSKPQQITTCYNVQAPINFEINEYSPTSVTLEYSRANLSDVVEIWRNDRNIAEVQQDDYIDVDELSPGETYSYYIGVKNACETVYSPRITITIPKGPKGSTILEANYVGSTYVCLSWTCKDLKHATNFVIERRDGTGQYVEISSVPSTTFIYKDTTIEQNATYVYRVAPINSYGTGEYSNPVKTITNYHAPVNLYVQMIDASRVGISWINVSDLYEEIEIQRSDNDIDTWRTINTIDGKENTYIDTKNILPQSQYYYRVRGFTNNTLQTDVLNQTIKNSTKTACYEALSIEEPVSKCDALGEGDYIDVPVNYSTWSKIECITIDRIPATPCLSVTQINSQKIRLNWIDNTAGYSDGYVIERTRTPDDDTSWKQLKNICNVIGGTTPTVILSYDDINVASENRYWYRMYSYVSTLKSGYSGVDGASTLMNRPFTPSIEEVAQKASVLKISWKNNLESVDSFQLSVTTMDDSKEVYYDLGSSVYSYDLVISRVAIYVIKIRSKKSHDYSYWSEQAFYYVALLAPAAATITGEAIGAKNSKIIMHDLDDLTTYIDLYRNNAFYKRLDAIDGIYYDFSLAQLTEYRYKIKCGNSMGVSAFSNEISLTTLKDNVEPPIISITNTNFDEVYWKVSSHIVYPEYKIERASDANFTSDVLVISGVSGTLPISGVDNENISPRNTYYYRCYGRLPVAYNSDFSTISDNGKFSAIIEHDQNAEATFVQAWDSNKNLIDVDSFDILDKNRLKIYLNQDLSGKLFLIASDNDNEKWSETITTIPDVDGIGYSAIIDHNLDISKPLVQCWKDNKVIQVQRIEDVNSNTIKIRTNHSITFEVKVFKPLSVESELTGFNTIPDGIYHKAIIEHNLDLDYPMIQIWKEKIPEIDEVILPMNIESIDSTHVALWFNSEVTNAYVRLCGVYNTNWSDPSKVITTVTAYEAVEDITTNLSGTATNKSVLLEWENTHHNGTDFRIYRRIVSRDVWFYIDSVGISVTEYNDTDLIENTTYQYYVIPWNSEFGEGIASNTITMTTNNLIPTDTPNHLVARKNATGNVILKWNFDQQEMPLLLERKLMNDSGYTQIAEILNKNLYEDTDISPNMYLYRIKTKYGNEISNVATIKIN